MPLIHWMYWMHWLDWTSSVLLFTALRLRLRATSLVDLLAELSFLQSHQCRYTYFLRSVWHLWSDFTVAVAYVLGVFGQ